MNRVYIALLLCIVLSGCITSQEPRVTSVVDGDTVKVNNGNQVETIRIIGIDSPETQTDAGGTGEFGVPPDDTKCLERNADEATEYAREKLLDKNVKLVNPPGTDNRGTFDRKLRVIKMPNGERYGSQLVSQGLARVYDDLGRFSNIGKYEKLERNAKLQQKGLWSCSAVADNGISVFEVRADARGSDTQPPSEYVEIGNTNSSYNFSQLRITDDSNNELTRRNFTLNSNSTIRVHTCKSGEQRSITWNYCSGIWNNGGDTVYIYDGERLIIKLKYE